MDTVPDDLFSYQLVLKIAPVEFLHGKFPADLCFTVEIFHVYVHPRADLLVNIHVGRGFWILDILPFKGKFTPVGIGNDEITEDERHQAEDDRRYHVREQHPAEADPVAENGNDLRICCHSRSKENNRDKYEEITEEVDKIGDEIQVVVEDDFI